MEEMIEQQQQQQQEGDTVPLTTRIMYAIPTFLTGAMIDGMASHGGIVGLGISGMVSYVAYRHGPQIWNHVQPILQEATDRWNAWQGQRSARQELEAAHEDLWEQQEHDLPPAVPIRPHALLMPLPDETLEHAYYTSPALHPVGQRQEKVVPLPVLSTESDSVEDLYDWNGQDDREATGPFTFSDVLASGFRPSIQRIFLGRNLDGRDIIVPATKICHTALAGRTGGGKGSLMRLLMAQLCYIGAEVVLLSPHFMRWVCADNDETFFDEDYTPFEGVSQRTQRPYLRFPPMECWRMPDIAAKLDRIQEWLAERKEKGALGGVKFKPLFVFLDEWPSITKIDGSVDVLCTLLREARKYGIYIVVASQDFLVKTMGMDGGSVRRCLLTAYYTGGDKTGAKELLNMLPDEQTEQRLGKGLALLRGVGTANRAELVRVPFVDNASLYSLLGPSTFVRPQEQEKERGQTEQYTTSIRDGRVWKSDHRHAVRLDHLQSHLYPKASGDQTSESSKGGSQQQRERGSRVGSPDFPTSRKESEHSSGQGESAFQEARETSDDGKYRFTPEEEALVVHLYIAYRSIDRVLSHMKRGARYQQHASEIIKSAGLLS